MKKLLVLATAGAFGLLALAGCGKTASPARHHHHANPVLIVGILAKDSGKTTAEVRALKTKGVKWTQVATNLGLSWSNVKGQLKAARAK